MSNPKIILRECSKCEHFLPIASNEFQGKCRRYPPAFLENALFIWPTVAVGARCGEFKRNISHNLEGEKE